MKTEIHYQWNGPQVKKVFKADLTAKMKLACETLAQSMKRSMKLSSPLGAPAGPGSPPNIQRARLKSSITSNWSESGKTEIVGGWAHQENESKYWVGQVGQAVPMPTATFPMITGVVGTFVIYSATQEFGLGRNKPHPFMRPAIESNISTLRNIFKNNATISLTRT
jgi:HK97 gp10 family phage protein